MLRKILLPTIFAFLAYGFWLSPNFNQISAGVAIFLFGMLSLEQGFRAFTGGTLERLLQTTTSTLWRSLNFGIVSTTLMQSSSLVSVITISFLSAGLISLAAGIGIIFGANLGTTTGAWLIAGFGLKVKISAYALPMLVFGIILVFQSSKTLKGIGYILAGLGFLFLGIHYMKEGFEAFRDTIDLGRFAVTGLKGLLLFSALGIAATVIMQSSHATLVLIITALAAQQISYENALALAIGANIGTTITAIIGSMSANFQGRRLAGAHLAFNLVTGLIAIIFISPLVLLVEDVSLWLGIADTDYTLKLAVFHSLFNLIGILVMLPLIQPLIRVLERLVPEKRMEMDQPKYLTNSAVDFPETAVTAVRQETLRVYDHALSIIIHSLGFHRGEVFSERDLDQIARAQSHYSKLDINAAYERSIKGIYSAIVAFISQADFSWQMEQSADLHHLRQANVHVVEAVKAAKHLQKNLSHYLKFHHPDMRRAYDRLRVRIAQLIRELEAIRQSEGDETDLLSLDALGLVAAETQEEIHRVLSELIRSRLISPEMASSLLNDSGYAEEIARHLIQAARTLFVANEREMTKAARTLALDETEIAEALEAHEEREAQRSPDNEAQKTT